ncbi:hypothetical protein FB45DRAFT_999408 [Roridomyces roridus]|uniref:Uncharacterized protein n=1 Tax=Roridomyces roridus TaxID=1738132 RepID=A0AAD7CBY5_9AGAR|nr:hypothetical protein FB45DRAFT_999408 [Roridomyces roridus]
MRHFPFSSHPRQLYNLGSESPAGLDWHAVRGLGNGLPQHMELKLNIQCRQMDPKSIPFGTCLQIVGHGPPGDAPDAGASLYSPHISPILRRSVHYTPRPRRRNGDTSAVKIPPGLAVQFHLAVQCERWCNAFLGGIYTAWTPFSLRFEAHLIRHEELPVSSSVPYTPLSDPPPRVRKSNVSHADDYFAKQEGICVSRGSTTRSYALHRNGARRVAARYSQVARKMMNHLAKKLQTEFNKKTPSNTKMTLTN